MDKETTIEELKNMTKKFMDDRDWRKFHTPKDLAITIATEASELLEIFRFKNDEEVEKILNSDSKIKVEDEIADVLLNIFRFSEMYGVDLSTALRNKIEKSEKKYPVEKCKGNNKKYNEY